MFGVDTSELVIVAIIALVFIGPKELPKAMRTVGYWIGRVRGMARHFTSGMETMMREAELEEMEKTWREENDRIMQLHPPSADYPDPPRRDDIEVDEGQVMLPLAPPQEDHVADDDDPRPPNERPLP